jgi:phenolic acid decarboxylase
MIWYHLVSSGIKYIGTDLFLTENRVSHHLYVTHWHNIQIRHSGLAKGSKSKQASIDVIRVVSGLKGEAL